MEQGVPVQIVASLAGHSSPSVTLAFYTHSVSDLEQEAVARLVQQNGWMHTKRTIRLCRWIGVSISSRQ
jgi:hypothetical protein